MILVRDVFQARYGKGGELVGLFKEARQKWPERFAGRILTDLSGSFFTVVTETEVASLGDWEYRLAAIFALPDFGHWFNRMTPLVESGRRELYNIEG